MRELRSRRAFEGARRWRLLGAVMLLSLMALACGGEEPAGTAGEATDTEAAATGTEDAGEPAEAETTEPAEEGGAATQAAGECPGAADLDGEQLEIAVPFSAGGGFDRQARVIGEALSEHFGVTPVVVNETGAGGLVSLNQHVTADPEELRIQYVQTPSSLAAQIAGAEGAAFTLEDWPWLARVTWDPQLAIASVDSGYESLEGMLGGGEQPRFAATGPGGIDYLHAQVLPAVFDAEVELVTGFGSTEEVVLTLASGDVDAYVLSARALLPAVEAGDAVPLALLDEQPSEDLPDVPLLTDLVEEGTEEAQLLRNYMSLIEVGRAFAAVPGADPERVETLSCMLEVVLADETVVELFEQEGDTVQYAPGSEMQELIVEAAGAGGQFQQLLEQSF